MFYFRRNPGKPSTLRGFPGVSSHFGPKIAPNLAPLGLGADFGPKMALPARLFGGTRPQNSVSGPSSPRDGMVFLDQKGLPACFAESSLTFAIRQNCIYASDRQLHDYVNYIFMRSCILRT